MSPNGRREDEHRGAQHEDSATSERRVRVHIDRLVLDAPAIHAHRVDAVIRALREELAAALRDAEGGLAFTHAARESEVVAAPVRLRPGEDRQFGTDVARSLHGALAAMATSPAEGGVIRRGEPARHGDRPVRPR